MKYEVNNMYIAIEGIPGIGKNEFANRLSKKIDARLVEDKYFENPFLPDFYKDPDKFDLSAQLYFFITRFNQQISIPTGDLFKQNIVSNYIFEKDKIYAAYILDDKKYMLYNMMQKAMTTDFLSPDLVVYFHAADPKIVYERIIERGREYEKHINYEYIKNLSSRYAYFFDKYKNSPLLIVNIEDDSFYERKDSFEQIYEEIAKGINGREILTVG